MIEDEKGPFWINCLGLGGTSPWRSIKKIKNIKILTAPRAAVVTTPFSCFFDH